MKSIRCPHCQSTLEVGIGYYQDVALNLRCIKCDKVILATTEEDEKELSKLYTKPTQYSHTHTHISSPVATRHGSHWHQPPRANDVSVSGGSAIHDFYEGCEGD